MSLGPSEQSERAQNKLHRPMDSPPSPPTESSPPPVAVPSSDATTWFVAVTSAFVLTVSKYHANTGEYADRFGRYASGGGAFAAAARAAHLPGTARWLAAASGPIADHLYWFLASFFLFVVLPLCAAAVTQGL